jgi:quercetin dioxygenase-like cupin family protein
MNIANIPFGTTDWSKIEKKRHAGTQGFAIWQTCYFGPDENRIRVRMVEYSPGYEADHWCKKGHILLCLEGEMLTELEDGRSFKMNAGTSYQVADNAEAHRSTTVNGAKLFIVD